jgi:predicted HTH domain antitoxin
MKSMNLNIPDNVEINNNELTVIIATRLYEIGKLSLGQASEMIGCSKSSFIELLGKYNISVFNYPASDLESDVRYA